MKTHNSILLASLAVLLALAPLRTPDSAVAPAGAIEVSAAEIELLSSVSRWLAEDSLSVVQRLESERLGFDAFRRWNPRELRRDAVSTLPWGPQIFEAAQRHSLDSLLVAAMVQVESGFRPDAMSPRGALGLMQVMPQTAVDCEPDELLVPAHNLEVGSRYLRAMLDRYDGDLVLALAAYNAGPGAVLRFGGVPPYAETQAYVEKVLAIYVAHHRRLWHTNRTTETLVFG